jgi:DNA-binding transcriptional regulator YdaS (Cro superfamily)
MKLSQYFASKPRGSKADLATKLGISRTWMSQIISGRRICSAELALAIEQLTLGEVKRVDMRPDLFGETR